MAYLGENIRKLGFGLMRLPKENDVIDVEQVKKMVDMFMDAGFTYFDTAWAYAGSEDAIREALVERYPRESYQLATKLAAWLVGTEEEAKQQFETSLKRTGADYFDFYLLHNLGEARTRYFDDFDLWDFVKEKKEAGLIKHLGISFHATPAELEEILENHPEIEFVQLQINYADWESAEVQSRACYETARSYGKSVVIMEPVKGGMLARVPESVEKVLKDAEPEMSPASWAIRFAANLEGVITVLSGMSSVEQMEDNLSYMRDFTGLTETESETIKRAQDELAKIPVIPCTTCNYCAKVCPNNIGISGSFSAMNVLTIYGDKDFAMNRFTWLVQKHQFNNPSECLKCGACEEACPQHIKIRDELEKISAIFE